MKHLAIFAIIIILICCFPISITGTSVGCNKVFSSYLWQRDYDRGNFSSTINVELSEINDEMQIIVTDVDLNVTDQSKNHNLSICIFDNIKKDRYCTYNYTEQIFYTVENTTTVSIWGYSADGSAFTIFNSVVDEQSFSPTEAPLFSKNEECVFKNGTQISGKQCCTSFIGISKAPTKSPKCIKFTSRSTIYNVTDNYSIYATSNMFYNLSHNIITSKGNISGPERFTVSYSINGYYLVFSDTRPTLNYTYSLPDGDSKLLFSISLFYNHNEQEQFFGRLILRNGITMTEEGIPFTPENDCLYSNYPYSETQISHHEFCCSQFVDIFD